MTKSDELLDPDVLLNSIPLTLYRLARDKYADLSGIGAAIEPGRWNVLGQEAIYTGLNSSTLQLEKLAHTPKDQIPSNLVMMKIEFSGDWSLLEEREPPILPEELLWLSEWSSRATFAIYRSLTAARHPVVGVHSMLQGLEPPAYPVGVAVPSIHDPQWNVVLFPQSAHFGVHVQGGAVERFSFDERLFPPGASKKPRS